MLDFTLGVFSPSIYGASFDLATFFTSLSLSANENTNFKVAYF